MGLTCTQTWEKGINKNNFHYISPIFPEALRGWICIKFGIGGPLVNVINTAKFFVDRFGSIDFVGDWNMPIPIGVEGRRCNIISVHVTHTCSLYNNTHCTISEWVTTHAIPYIIGRIFRWYSTHSTVLYWQPNSHNRKKTKNAKYTKHKKLTVTQSETEAKRHKI